MLDGEITFFQFKEDAFGGCRFGAITVYSPTLCIVTYLTRTFSPRYKTESDYKDWLVSVSRYARWKLEGKVLIGHGIIKSDIPRFTAALEKIGMEPPRFIDVYDTLDFKKFDWKLAKIAKVCGLGKGAPNVYKYLLQNINAIKHCEGVMSVYEPDKLKKYCDGVYNPIISYLMDLTNVTSRFSGLDIDSKKEAESKIDMEE